MEPESNTDVKRLSRPTRIENPSTTVQSKIGNHHRTETLVYGYRATQSRIRNPIFSAMMKTLFKQMVLLLPRYQSRV